MFEIENTKELAELVLGELIGGNKEFKGVFTTLGRANKGDVAIRHWIDAKGVEIANSKGLTAIITQNPRDNAKKTASKLNFPLIVVDKIEIANAIALKWTISKFAFNSKKVVVTGTNGKSTTTHLIYNILSQKILLNQKSKPYNVFTNTDANSEFNTLIDPMVSVLILEYFKSLNPNLDIYLYLDNLKNSNDIGELKTINDSISNKLGYELNQIDYLVIEVSEVQGWLNRFMENHASYMVDAIKPDVSVITNISLDHIGLVKSINEIENEILNVIKTIEKGTVVLNNNDNRLSNLSQYKNNNVNLFLQGDNTDLEFKKNFLYNNEKVSGIFYRNDLLIELDMLPFKTNYFISNILSAIGVCLNLNIPYEIIVEGVKSYKSLNRRFSIINKDPLIIDDFAHNPEGINSTIESVSKLSKSKLWVICSIRGSRGEDINLMNSQALANSFNKINPPKELVISNSEDVVDHLNEVLENEMNIFLNVLDSGNIEYKHFNKLKDSLTYVISNVDDKDTILLIGAQGMDPAGDIVKKII